MLGKNNKHLKITKEGTKVESYSIKKFKVGAASVVVGASIFFGAGVAAASEDVTNNTTADNTTNSATAEEAPKAVAVEAPVVETPKQATTEEVAAAVTAKEEVKEADKSTLEANIKKLEDSLNAVDSSKAPASTLAAAKVQLENAKAVLANNSATQEEVNAAAKKVSEQNFVISSMPKAGAVEKEVKEGANSIQNTGSNDPRNGQSMGEGVALRADNPGTSTDDTTNNGTHIVTTNDDVPIDQKTKDAIDKLKLGEGVGVLVDKTQTVSPDMQDPNGAKLEDPKSSMLNTTPTSNKDYHTFGYFGLHWLDFAGVDKQLPQDYYMRASTNKDDSKTDILLEMVKFSDQSVVESHTIGQTQVADFTSLQSVATKPYTKSYPIKALYDTTARDESKNIAGQVILYFAQIAGGWSMGSYNIPMNSAYVTKYVTDDGKLLATYSIKGSSKQMSTPSDVRKFSGYIFKETQVSGSPKLNVYNIDAPELDAKNYQYKRLLEMVKADGTAVKSLWVVDPTLSEEAKAKLNFADESTDGFIKVLETSQMEPGGVNENIKVITGQKLSDGTTLISEEEAAEIEKKAGDNDGVNFGTNNTVKIWQDPNNAERYIRLGFVGNYGNVRPYGVTTPGKSAYMQTTWAPQTNYKLVPLENDALYIPTILHVYTKAGDVVVKYVDQDGNEISGTGLTSVDATTGTTIPAGGQTAVEKTTLSDNNPISYDTATENLKPAVIKDANGNIYYLMGVDADKSVYDNNTTNITEDDTKVGETGTVRQGTTTVTYKYGRPGSVVVKYITTDGTKLEGDFTFDDATSTTNVPTTGLVDVKDEKPGEQYSTTDHKPTTIKTADGKVYKLVEKAGTTSDNITYGVDGVATGEGNAAGTGSVLANTTQTVTYVYEEVKGNVVVKYETKDGTQLSGELTLDNTSANVDKDGVPVPGATEVSGGTSYDSSKLNKPTTITTKDGKVYRLVAQNNGLKEGSAPENGENAKVIAGETRTVTYLYEEVKGNVVVKYETKDGTPLEGKLTADGKEIEVPTAGIVDTPESSIDTPYNTIDNRPTTIVTADGKTYKLTATKGNEEGKVVEGTTTITYVYEEVKGSVEVNYVDEKGNPISGKATGIAKDSVNSTEKDETGVSTGTKYDTADLRPATITTKDGKVYKLVAENDGLQNGSAPSTGKVEAGKTTEVTYVYKEVKGNVVVKYETTDGTTLTGNLVFNDDRDETTVPETGRQVEDATDASGGTKYDTTDYKPTTITTADGKVYKLVEKNNGLKDGSAPESGDNATVIAGETRTVTYLYEEVKGSVEVNYVDVDGKPISGTTTGITKKSVAATEADVDADGKAVTNVSGGTKYDTTDLKPKTITTADGTVYYLVTKAVDGKYSAEGVQVGSDAETGEVEAGKTTKVTYVYEKAGSVTVNYVDKDGNVIKAPVTDEDNVEAGTKYDTTDKKPTTITTKDGKVYKLVPNETKGSETGTVVSGENTQVTYVYEEVKGNVLVHYVVKNADGTTTQLQPDYKDVTNASIGTEYNTAENTTEKPLTIVKDGKTYKLVESATIGTQTGTVKEGTTEVTYVYEEVKGNVVVKYETKEGTPLEGKLTADGKEIEVPTTGVVDTPESSIDTPYNTADNKPTTIVKDGKTYRLVPTSTKGNEEGKVVEGTTTVTYVYEEVKGSVEVNYVDENGKPISGKATGISKDSVNATEKDETDVSTGTKYDTKDLKPTTITAADGTVYYYKEVKSDSAPENGEVKEGTTKVTYVYEKAGSVKVNYVDEKGNVIKDPVMDENASKPRTKYDTTDNKPTTITTKDGKTYELVEVKGNESGEVKSGETLQVTYVYKLVPMTKFVEEGTEKELSTPEKGTQNPKAITGYELVRTVTDKDGNTVHIYKKVTNPTTGKVTKYLDENGNPVSNEEAGTKPKKDIPGYEYVRTYTDKDGNTVHVYKKVVTPTTPEKEEVKPTSVVKEKQLPNTEATSTNSANAAATGAGLIAMVAAAIAARRKRNK